MVVVIVTGTPGTGKSTVAKRLARHSGLFYLDVNNVISKEHLSKGYDRARKCRLIDTQELNRHLKQMIKRHGDIIIDSHLSHFLPHSSVDLCIITRCGLKLLRSRLKRRGYSKDKVVENLEVEIMEVIPNEVAEAGHNYIFVDTDKKVDYSVLKTKVEKLKKRLK